MYLLLRWIINALSLVLVTLIVPGIIFESFYSALITALFLGIVNAIIRPIIIILTLPINVLTLGLFTLIINGFLFWLVSTIVEGFEVAGFGAAILGALVLWLISWITNLFLNKQ